MKRITKFCSLLLLTIIGFLSGCGFTNTSTGRVIASIERIEEGDVVKMVIKYEDEEYPDDVFILPNGPQGTGIETIAVKDNDEGSGRVVTIYLTDRSDPASFEIKDGVSITGIESEIDEEGNQYIWVVYSNQTTSEKLLIPKGEKGDQGVGFSGYDYTANPDGSQKFVFKFSDGSKVDVDIPAPNDGKDGIGIKNIVSGETAKEYILTITYTDNTFEQIKFNKPADPNQWLSGSSQPINDEGKNGDYYYDKYHQVIYFKENNVWTEVIAFGVSQVKYTITFNLNDTDDLDNPASMPAGSLISYKVAKGTYFQDSTNGIGEIPIPYRNGYRFVGWYRTKIINANSSKFTDLTPVYSDLVLYAQWEPTT